MDSRSAPAASSAFIYQGNLKVNGTNVTGNYDLTFDIHTNLSGTGTILGARTNLNTPVTNGLFTTTLDFGPDIFTGTNLWLAIGVRPAGSTNPFSFLSPLQAMNPVPYAISAQKLSQPLSGDGSGLTNINWPNINNRPTTLAGYGITDAVSGSTASNLVAATAESHSTNLDYLSSLPLSALGTMPAGVQANEFRTPPMGYNTFYSSGTSVNEYLLTNAINTMVQNGMAAAGYVYVNIDDGWAGGRDTNGNVVLTLTNGTFSPQTPQTYVTNVFPHGMKFIADYAHSNGMKLGIYTVVAPTTCAGYVGSASHIQQDINTYANWGIDYLKVETCGSPATNDFLGLALYKSDAWGWARAEYEAMANAIQHSYRPMFFNVSWWWNMEPWLPSEVNSWRGAGDVTGENSHSPLTAYTNELFHFDFIARFSYLTGPGHFVDPDVILTDALATPGHARSIFGAYAMMSAPLIVSQPTGFAPVSTNAGMISIDQDPLVMPAHVIGSAPYISNNWVTEDNLFSFPHGADQQVWVKNLQTANGPKKAVLFLNRATTNATMSINWTDMGIPPNIPATVYNCWTNSFAGNFVSNFTATVPAEDCGLFIIQSDGLLPTPGQGQTYLSDLGWLDNSQCGGAGLAFMFKDQSFAGNRAISIGGVTYKKGFGAFSPSSINIHLGGITGRFHSDYGFDDDAGPNSRGAFQVWGDGIKLFDSGTVQPGTPKTVDIGLSNVTNLSLVTVPVVLSGNDTVDWGNTYVISTLSGDGGAFTNLNAANLTGTVPDSSLSANVARLNANQTFTGTNIFNGNVGIGTNSPAQKLVVAGNILATGTITGSSDRNVKENFSSVDIQSVLDKVCALPILRWNYKADAGQNITHIGPMAQDFYLAFALGMDDRHISMVDADGVALAAIQALNKKLDEKTAEITDLKKRLERLEQSHPPATGR